MTIENTNLVEYSIMGGVLASLATMEIALLDDAIQDASFLSEDIKNASSTWTHRTLSDIGDHMPNVVNVLEWKGESASSLAASGGVSALPV